MSIWSLVKRTGWRIDNMRKERKMASKSVVVAGMQFGSEFLSNVCKAVLRRGGTHEQVFDALKTGSDLAEKLAELIVGARTSEFARRVFTVFVDCCTQSFSDMVKAGKYDWVNSNITEKHFPIQGNGKITKELHLIHFNKVMSSEGVLAEFERLGLAPAKIEDLLVFGVVLFNLQRQFPIVALGSVWRHSDGGRGVPCLSGRSGDRDLGLGWLGDGWDERYRFLAVSK